MSTNYSNAWYIYLPKTPSTSPLVSPSICTRQEETPSRQHHETVWTLPITSTAPLLWCHGHIVRIMALPLSDFPKILEYWSCHWMFPGGEWSIVLGPMNALPLRIARFHVKLDWEGPAMWPALSMIS